MPDRNPRVRPRADRVLVVVPWLEGGGAQAVLEELVRRVPSVSIRLVVLFGGCRDHERVLALVDSHIEYGLPRTPVGALEAAWRVRAEVHQSDRVFSLIRGSHVVLGLFSAGLLQSREFAASFHQLPSTDRAGIRGRLEDIACRRAMRCADLVTTPSPRARDELVAVGLCHEDQVLFDPNPIAQVFTRTAPPRPVTRDRLRVVLAGRLTPQKGIDRLEELTASIDTPVDLDVYGAGELAAEVGRLERRHHPHVRVTLRGRSADMAATYDSADAVLLPSRWELNPMVVWEAWARGRPVLASDIDVHRDLARQGPLWTFGDGAELARIIRVIADPGCRDEAFDRGTAAASKATSVSAIETFLRSGAVARDAGTPT